MTIPEMRTMLGDEETLNIIVEHDEVLVVEVDEGLPGPVGPPGPQGPQGEVGPQGPPGSVVTQVHFQNEPAKVWEIQHNLPHAPYIKVFDAAGNEIWVDVHYPAPGLVRVEFAFESTGMVQLL